MVEEIVQQKLKQLIQPASKYHKGKIEFRMIADLHAKVDKNHAVLNSQISLSKTSLPHGTLRLTLLFFVSRELTINSVSFSVIILENLNGLKLLKIGEALPSGASSPKAKKTQNGIILNGFKRSVCTHKRSQRPQIRESVPLI